VKPGGGAELLAVKPAGVALRAGETIVVETPGAGGYGPPEERAAEALEEDRRSGKFSRRFLARHYEA
jgi:N-methylhydantoinase B